MSSTIASSDVQLLKNTLSYDNMTSRKRPRESTSIGINTVEKIRSHINQQPASVSTSSTSSIYSPSTSDISKSTNSHNTENGVEHMTICKPASFYNDPEAISARKNCDYETKITYEMARKGMAPRRVRVYADGIYDMFHQGHARQLMQAKNVFPNVYLIVGVCSDALTHEMKGRTVMTDKERYEAVRHCRYVDEVICEAPWVLSDQFLEDNKIDFVAHDEIPYGEGDVEDIYAPLKSRGMFVATERTEGVSTSDIVARIVKDYDIYVRRNLARGYSAKDLNVSFINEKKFRLQNKIDNLKDKGKRVIENIGEKTDDFLMKWEEKSSNFIETFLLLFGRDRLSTFWNESKGRLMQALSPPGSPFGSENGDTEDPEIPESPPMKKKSIGLRKTKSSHDLNESYHHEQNLL